MIHEDGPGNASANMTYGISTKTWFEDGAGHQKLRPKRRPVYPRSRITLEPSLNRTGRNLDMRHRGAQTPLPPKIPRGQIHNALRAHAPVNGTRPGMARRCADAKENFLVPPPVKPPNGERSTRDQAGGRPPARIRTGVKIMRFSLEGLEK